MEIKKPISSVREEIIENFLKKYDFLKRKIIGKSHCERKIECLELGNQDNSVLLSAAFHGLEWQTTLVTLKFLEELCENYKNIKVFLKKQGVTIIPCVNPDGVEISTLGAKAAGKFEALVKNACPNPIDVWQANAAGVDINHNFDANWEHVHKLEQKIGITKPGPTRYGGPYPESEPETITITRFCKERNFNMVYAYHSQGEEIFWNFGEHTPKESKKIAEELAKASGYTVSTPEEIATGGGFKDWFIEKFHKPGFTIEIGCGKNPLPLSDFESIYKKIRKMMFLSIM